MRWSIVDRFAEGFGLGVILCLLMAAVPTVATAQSIQASLDRTAVFMGDTVLLRIELKNPAGEQAPDYSALRSDFDVLDSGSNARVEIVNSRRSVMIEYNALLEPKRTGTYTIPPIPVGNMMTQPLELVVTERPDSGSGPAGKDVFIEVEALPRDPYVHAQVRLTIRLYHAPPITEGSLTPEAWPNDAVVERLGDDVTYQTKVNGQRYRVIERRYALFPERSGAITIPEIRFRGRVADANTNLNSLFSRGRRISISSDPIALEVRPTPADYSGDVWLPAANLEVIEAWPNGEPEFVVGEPLTRTLVTKARGLLSAQLPEFSLPPMEGIKSYPDQPTSQTRTDGSWALAQREEKFALVPTVSGELVLPEIRIPWWDTEKNVEKIVVIPERRVTVADAPAGATVATAADIMEQFASGTSANELPRPGPWKELTFLFAALWLITLAVWHRGRRAAEAESPRRIKQLEDKTEPSRRALKRAFVRACESGDPRESAAALLKWANEERLSSGGGPPGDGVIHSLANLAKQLEPGSEADGIMELDSLLYGKSGDQVWNGRNLSRLLGDGLPFKAKTHGKPEEPVLPPLYPA